jgi:hypothetical protein
MKRHRLDPVSLLCGLVFAGLGLSLLTGALSPSTRHLDLVWPAAVVVLGLALLASGRDRREPVGAPSEAAGRSEPAPPPGEPEPTEPAPSGPEPAGSPEA